MEAKLQALLKQVESGKMVSDTCRILRYAIRRKAFFLPEVMRDLNLRHQTATARISGLEDLGILKKGGLMKTKYGSKFSIYKYEADPIGMATNAHERKMKKMNLWLKKWRDFEGLISVDELTERLANV